MALGFFVTASFSQAHEFSGFIGAETRLFPNSALHLGQKDDSISFVAQPEYYHEFEGGSSFTFVPFYRFDSADRERTHFDIRELTFLWLKDDFELRLGVRKVFWGTTEILHLVDIINQTDLVENVDAEDKLGQPMANISFLRDWGTFDLYWLPYFRERTFVGTSGRLRGSAVVDADRTQYGSGAEEWHSDWAFRYSHFLGDWDVGLAQFVGTSRDPTLLNGTDPEGNAIKIPKYEQIKQTSLDVSYVINEWLWKGEALYRTGQGNDDYFAWTGGFEYTFTRVWNTQMDLGVIGEWMFDTREDEATTAFENDLAGGIRLALNDSASTEALFSWVQDLNSQARFLFLEASRRFGDHLLLTAELRAFINQPAEDFLFEQRADEIMQIELAYYF
ncbi:MAG TPA: hypothetical protein EYF96_03150 [Nitrospinaceae bacterium]|nr:hypothetical protein [Nitrospinaceae bacterium]